MKAIPVIPILTVKYSPETGEHVKSLVDEVINIFMHLQSMSRNSFQFQYLEMRADINQQMLLKNNLQGKRNNC